jgi:hypothetical protein
MTDLQPLQSLTMTRTEAPLGQPKLSWRCHLGYGIAHRSLVDRYLEYREPQADHRSLA